MAIGVENANLIAVDDGAFYLALKTECLSAQECDACGSTSRKGYNLYFLGDMDRCVLTGSFSCSLGCARQNAMSE